MNSNRLCVARSVALFAAALGAATLCIAGEASDHASARLDALEMRVAALEQKGAAQPAAPVDSGVRRADPERAKAPATSLELYLKYPGQ